MEEKKQENDDSKILIPRPFQTELLEKAIERDIIIHLKTGSGKTFISVMVVNSLSNQVEMPYSKGGKRSIFLAITVPLVMQQADYLRKHSHLKVGDYYGDKIINGRVLDSWDAEIWKNELEKNQVLVMTPQIFYDMINFSFINFEKINLIIFDECHHATRNHPYSLIITKYQEKKNSDSINIRILGMTASIVNRKCTLTQFKNMMKQLEDKFGCKIETASIVANEDENIGHHSQEKPKIEVLIYENKFENDKEIIEVVEKILSEVTNIDDELQKSKRQKKETMLKSVENSENDNMIFSSDNDNPFKIIKREISDLENIIKDLGLWSFRIALQDLIEKFKNKDIVIPESFSEDSLIKRLENLFQNQVSNRMKLEGELSLQEIRDFSSEKLNCLIDIYEKYSENSSFHSIIFVERKSTAKYIDIFLKKLSQFEELNFIKSDYLFGVSGVRNNMTLAKQDKILKKFRRHEINVLVSTNIVEEGVDVPACNMVVRFNKISNFGSYIQSKGRARSKQSSFYILRSIDEPEDDLVNFLEIEKDLEENLKSRNNDDDNDDFFYNQDDNLNSIIRPYVKGKCEITCHKAIDLLNRYCSTLENNLCGVLYPIYSIETFEFDDQKYFICSLRLPPNSVINKTIQSERFPRKKLAKMDAALKMCIELDKAGELAENLTILSKEDWLNSHFNFEENLAEDKKLGKKVGSTKLKREYDTSIADELLENHPEPNKNSFLYIIKITEEVFDQNFPFVKQITDDTEIGLLVSKKLPIIPRFKLYRDNSQFYVTIIDTGIRVVLDFQQYEKLKKFNEKIFKDMLKIKIDLNFDNPIYGGLFVVLLKNKLDVDWNYLNSIHLEDINAYEFFSKNNDEFIVCTKNFSWLFKNQLVSIREVEKSLTPNSEFPNKAIKCDTFKDYFKTKYDLETVNENSPLVQIDYLSNNMNFILRGLNCSIIRKNKVPNFKILLIMEHLKFVPVQKNQILKFCMFPAILYRLDCILRARKLQLTIENEIKMCLGLKEIKNENSIWDKSFKFHKINYPVKETDVSENKSNPNTECKLDNNSDDQTDESDDEYLRIINQIPKNDELMLIKRNENLNLNQNELMVPPLLIKEKTENFVFPNAFNILQCLTLKSACDNFDLERYEVLGDCYLKLLVVMKIYVDFSSTNEGKMASLKSARVSNNYLYKLAIKKKLNEFIVWKTFIPESNWIPPNLDKKEFLENPQFKTKLADKSLADCVEALIGLYLIYLGSNAAKAFIEWLDFRISDKLGKTNFTTEYVLPNPAFINDESIVTRLSERYSEFEQMLGYSFKNKFYILQAFTHPSDINNRFTSSYQKLELVGDAVLDILITQHIFQDEREHSPGELTDLRQSLVNNKFFGHLAVKHDFYKYLSHSSRDIFNKLNEYVREHEIYPPDAAYLGIKKEENFETDDFELETPKFLADVFESIAGAIYLDSNCDLQAVWNVYYKMIAPYFIAFKDNIPCSPIKALYILKPQSVVELEIKIKENEDEVEGEGEVDIEKAVEAILKVDDKCFTGFGRNKTIAKAVAYKKAVREYDDSKNIIFF